MLGGLMLGAGVLLFVSAHWDALSPSTRFSLILLLVAGFHLAGGDVRSRFEGLAITLHTLGTIALGAGVFLAGQIFNMEEHWPGGVMLWAIGAASAWAILRDLPQMLLTAILVPAWVASEWTVRFQPSNPPLTVGVVACGAFLLLLTYFTAVVPGRADRWRRALMWLGGLGLPGAAISLAMWSPRVPTGEVSLAHVGWVAAVGLPVAVAVWIRGASAWMNGLAALWVAGVLVLRAWDGDVGLYVWWGLGAIGLVAWGLVERRPERVNMGSALFAATVIAFYSSHVMDKLGRSASLIGFGALFLAGGWGLERVRRRLVIQTRAERT
jgi:uncharacterized membrane protein